MDERIPPHDMVAEQSTLGGMMLSKTALWEASEVVASVDFYEPKHGVVFDAITSLLSRDKPVDALSVTDELRRAGTTQQAGGDAYVHHLTSVAPTAANAAYYAIIVRSMAMRRRLIEAGGQVLEMGYSGREDVDELVESARAKVDHVSGLTHVEPARIGTAFAEVIDELNEQPVVIETPWREINDILVGLRPGRFYAVGARPGEGKSIVGAQLAMAMCVKGPVVYTSLEMGRGELLQRMIASQASVHMGSIERNNLSDEEWGRVAMVRGKLDALPLYVDDRPELSITQIRGYARTVSRKGQLGGIVIDYLQLIGGTGSEATRYDMVSDVSRQLKLMSREFDCPVIALSQFKRPPQMQGKQRKHPTLEDFRESGSIEQDCDVAILLQRGQAEDGLPDNRLRMHIAKNRHGRQGYRNLLWEGAYARVSSWSNSSQYELPIPD